MKKTFLMICAVALSKLCFSQVPTAGLIAQWEFTGNLNDGVGTNNGTWQGSGPPNYVPDRCGIPKRALHFNGVNQFIQMVNPGISGNGARSLSLWMRVINPNSGVRAMFNDGQFSPGPIPGTRWEVNHDYNCQGVGVDITLQYITRPSVCIDDGNWHHVVVTQAANAPLSSALIYIDGNVVNTLNCSTTNSNNANATIAQAITIGAVPAAPGGRYFAGALDDFYYYNVVLTPAQVAQLFYDKCIPTNSTCGPLPPQPPGPCCLGNVCGTGLNPLTSPWEIPLAGNKFIFSQAIGGAGRVGIGQMATSCLPGNLLEVRRGATSSISGLRLTDLAGAAPAASNGSVLSIDPNGDVILVPEQTVCCIGNACGASANPIPAGGWEIPFGGNSYNYTKSGALSLFLNQASQLNIGFANCLTTNPGRVNSLTDVHRFAGAFVNNNGFTAGFECVGVGGRATSTQTNAIGARGEALSAPAVNAAIGVYGGANDQLSTAGVHIGVNGTASYGGQKARGGLFQVLPSSNPANDNVGAVGDVNVTNNPNANNVGGAFTSFVGGNRTIGVVGGYDKPGLLTFANGVSSLPAGMRIGVYGYSGISNNPSNLPNTFIDWAGYFDGDVNIMGLGYVTGFTPISSDVRFKDKIQNVSNALDKIKNLSGHTYEYRREEFAKYNFPAGRQYGFIAQELKEQFPELVVAGPGGYNYVNYTGMIPVLLEAIKEQQKQIDDKTGAGSDTQKQLDDLKKANDDLKNQNTALNSRLDQLEQMISSCCSSGQAGSKTNPSPVINLSDKNVIVLNQNVPNPFAERTIISYSIPTDFAKAQLVFSTNDGKIIKTVDITVKGEGSFNVYANDLSNGLYTYSLIVDGKVIDTKKMVKGN